MEEKGFAPISHLNPFLFEASRLILPAWFRDTTRNLFSMDSRISWTKLTVCNIEVCILWRHLGHKDKFDYKNFNYIKIIKTHPYP